MASTTSSSTSGFFSSPRAQKALYWISGIVFVAGVVAIVTVYATRGSSTPAAVNPPSNSSQVSTPPKHVAASADAKSVARRFLETAVVRKNLAESYNLVGPLLKGGITLKQWKSGNNTVVPYPANNAKTTALIVKSSTPNNLLLQVALVAKPGSHTKPQSFALQVNKINGRWVVNSFTPLYQAPVRPGNGQG